MKKDLGKIAEDILDKSDSLPDTAFEWASLYPYLSAFLLMLVGYFVASLNLSQYLRKKDNRPNPLHQKIKEAKDEKALLKLLLSRDNPSYTAYITTLEEALYHDRKVSLQEIKERLLTL